MNTAVKWTYRFVSVAFVVGLLIVGPVPAFGADTAAPPIKLPVPNSAT